MRTGNIMKVLSIVVLFAASLTFAADKKDAAPKKSRNDVCDWFSFGGDLRSRIDYYGNYQLDKKANSRERLYQRHRARLWAKIKPIKDIQFNLRLCTEPRFWCKPESMHQRYGIFFDIFNVEVKNIFGIPLKATVGRQEMSFGDGWLIKEGTPRDGSRSTFFDAIRLTYEAKAIDTTFDFAFIYNRQEPAAHIKPFNDGDWDNLEYDEHGIIVYASNKSVKNTVIDGYFIYRDTRPQNHIGTSEKSYGWDSELYTFGTRVAHKFNANWSARGEIAGQFGHKDDYRVCALGANSRLTYQFNDALCNKLHLDYEFRSGGRDNPRQSFDPLWGRYWDRASVYSYGVATVGGEHTGHAANNTNMHRVGFGWDIKPLNNVSVNMAYHLMFADQNNMSGSKFTDSGCFRGQLFTTKITHKINSYLTHRVLSEFFFPGNYYGNINNDTATFLKYEIIFKW